MSQTIDNLNAAVAAALTKISELYDENAALAAQNAVLQAHKEATYAVLEDRATALEAAAAADAAAEQDAADKLTAGVAAASEPAPTTAEVDAAAAF